MLETTALGAAFFAGLGVGFWASPEAITAAWAEDRAFEPEMDPAKAEGHRAAWAEAVKRP